TNVIADRMFARQRDQFVHYDGHVRAWHGPDVIESSSLDYYGRERRLSSGSQVLTSHLAPAPGPQKSSVNRSARSPVIRSLTVRAAHLEYLESIHRATYSGNVQLQDHDTTLKADKMDVWLSQNPGSQGLQVDNVVVDGHVLLIQPGKRATGEHGTYFAD